MSDARNNRFYREPVAAATGEQLSDFTAALAAADLKWSHDLGDPPSEPDYIQALAGTVWQLWVQPRVAENDRLTRELADARASYWEVKETLESLKCERGGDL